MAYADLLDDEGINSQYLVVMRPRKLIDATWTISSGTIYTTPFSFTDLTTTLTKVVGDGAELTEAASSSVSSNEWHYDPDTSVLTIDLGSDPNNSEIIVTYEIYFGTFDAHINRVPTDSSTRSVYFEPLITKSPNLPNSTSDVLFGFLPTFSATITISNSTSFLNEHLYASSFSNAIVDVYHWLGNLENDNIKLVLKAQAKSVSYTDKSINFSLLDRTQIFDQEYRNQVGTSFYSTSAFSNLNPQFEGRPIRQVFGVVEGFIPVNIDYVKENATTSDNRDYAVIADETNLSNIITTAGGGTHTTTRTYITSADGFRVGDQIQNASSNQYAVVSVVNKVGAPYVDHGTWTAATDGHSIRRAFIGKVQILKSGVLYEPLYGRDWDVTTDGTNKVAGFSFTTSMESNLSIDTLTVSDSIFCRVYGHSNTTTLGGPAFGSDSSETGSLTDPVVILFQLLKDLGIPEAEINTSSFSSLQSSISDEVGFAIPPTAQNNFPNYKDLIIAISQTLLLKVFLDDDATWKISQIGPLGTADKTIGDDEILVNSVNYTFDYKDIISLAIVQYQFREVSETGSTGGDYSKTQSSSTIAKNLHDIERQKTFTSLHFNQADAQTLASRIRYALGERRGIATFRTKNRFFDTLLDEVIDIERTRLPGFSFDEDTDRSRDFAVTKTSKSLQEITISIDDQKGIEDNSGSW